MFERWVAGGDTRKFEGECLGSEEVLIRRRSGQPSEIVALGHPGSLEAFLLENCPNARRLITLNLDLAVLHRSAAAAGGPELFSELIDRGEWQMWRENVHDDDGLPSAMRLLAPQDHTGEFPRRGFWRNWGGGFWSGARWKPAEVEL